MFEKIHLCSLAEKQIDVHSSLFDFAKHTISAAGIPKHDWKVLKYLLQHFVEILCQRCTMFGIIPPPSIELMHWGNFQ